MILTLLGLGPVSSYYIFDSGLRHWFPQVAYVVSYTNDSERV